MSPSAFAAPNMPTMRDALDNLNSQAHIPTRKLRRWQQDVLAACKWLGFEPEDLIANHANLNPRFRRLSRGTLGKRGLSKKRISNVKNSIKHVLRCLPSQDNRSFKIQLTPEWESLAKIVPDKYRRASVHCITTFGSAQNIQPEDFDDEASARLLAALINERLNGNPIITHQNAVRASNWLRSHVPGWTVPVLTPPRRTPSILPWSAFPKWVEIACQTFVKRNTTTDPFDLSRPMKAWRPATVKTYLTLLRRYFSMLVHSGCDLETKASLREIATFEMAELGLRWMTEHSKKSKGGHVTAASVALLLAQIALNPDLKSKLSEPEKSANGAVAAELQKLASRLLSEDGLSCKTRDRLSPLKDETNLAKLFLLPYGIERSIVKTRKAGRRIALLTQWALALMILTFCPLRISTLCSISDRNLRWSREGRRGELTLELEGAQLKSGEPESIPLPPECARIIRIYLMNYRHLLVRGQTQFLFPGATANRSKGPATMSTQLSRLIWDRLGFRVNPHLYRHIVHLVILKRFPGAYVMISRVLTHKSLETAVRNYSYFDTELSMKAFHQLVREVQTGTSNHKSASLSSIAYSHTEYDNGSR